MRRRHFDSRKLLIRFPLSLLYYGGVNSIGVIHLTLAKHITINGHHLYINIVGEGEPIIFLHGGPGSEHRFFLPHVLPLAKDYQLILYDQRGCGSSAPLPGDNYSIEEEIKTLESLRDQLQLEKINLFGESWGSMLALSYAATYPEKVNKLFLTAAIGINNKGFNKFKNELLKKISVKDKIKLVAEERKVKKGQASTDDVLEILDPYYVYDQKILLKKKKTTINHTVNHIIVEDIENNYDLTGYVEKLANIPILIAQGSHDILTPAMIEGLLLNYIPHAQLETIENCGHWTVIEKPEEINSLVKHFFQEQYEPIKNKRLVQKSLD